MYKKLISTVLALAMVFSSCAFAFADTSADAAEEAGGMIPEATKEAVPNLLIVNFMEALEKAEAARDAAEKAAAEEAARKAEEAALLEAEQLAASGEAAEGEAVPAGPETEVEKIKREIAEAKSEREQLYKEGLAHYMRRINTNMGEKWSLNLAQCFIDTAEKYDLDERVLMAMAQRESRFNSQAKSAYGYKGMMQTSDWLAKHYGYKVKDVFDYEVSLDVAARYLRSLKDSFKTYTKALSGYVYGGVRVKNGNYSTKHAKKILETRDTITEFLEKRNYIETEKEEDKRKASEADALAIAEMIDEGIVLNPEGEGDAAAGLETTPENLLEGLL